MWIAHFPESHFSSFLEGKDLESAPFAFWALLAEVRGWVMAFILLAQTVLWVSGASCLPQPLLCFLWPSEAWSWLCSRLFKSFLQDPLTSAWQPLLEDPPVWHLVDPGSCLHLPEIGSKFRLVWCGKGSLKGDLSQCPENGQCPQCFLGIAAIPEVKDRGESDTPYWFSAFLCLLPQIPSGPDMMGFL